MAEPDAVDNAPVLRVLPNSQYVPVSPDRLLPQARESYEAAVKVSADPVPVVLNTLAEPADPAYALKTQVVFPPGEEPARKPYFSVAFRAINMTFDEINATKLSNADLAAAKPYAADVVDSKARAVEAAEKAFAHQLQEEGVLAKDAPLPSLLSKKDFPRLNSDAMAYTTKEGTPYFVLDPSLSEKDTIAVMAHEFGHISLHHNDPEHIKAQLNDLSFATSKQDEHAADAIALRLGQGDALADYQAHLQKRQAREGLSLDDMAAHDPNHPRIEDRIHFLREGAAAQKAEMPDAPAPDASISRAEGTDFSNLLKGMNLSSFQQMSGGIAVAEPSAPAGNSKPSPLQLG